MDTTTVTAPQVAAGPGGEQPAYRYAGDGKFEPANQAALDECQRWNTYAALWNERTAARSLRP